MPHTVPEQKERNDALVNDYEVMVKQLGQPVWEVASKYNMSTTRMYQILEKRGVVLKKRFSSKPKKNAIKA